MKEGDRLMINVAIIGYGNLGKGVQQAISKQNDMELFGVFTKRDPKSLDAQGANLYAYDNILDYKNDIDVLIHCGSSEFDLPTQTPELVKNFNIVDSYDQHAIIAKHIDAVGINAMDKTAIVSVGWDPGFFSMTKTVLDAILPDGETQGFFGPGISQGPSNVASSIEGVKVARNYSFPNEDNLKKFKNFEPIDVSENTSKICYVVLEEGADKEKVTEDIMNIEHYFKGSNTEIKFISEETMEREHSEWPQGGRIVRIAKTSDAIKHVIEVSIDLDSNPEFTAANLVAYARACVKMNQRSITGVYTALDVRPSDLSSKSRAQLIEEML